MWNLGGVGLLFEDEGENESWVLIKDYFLLGKTIQETKNELNK